MTSEELRQKFIKFFEEKGHKLLPSSSLVPQDDPSVLLTTAGMQQFKKWFTGIEHPTYGSVVTVQKCIRIDDIDEVGDETHMSFFEMLGNFSFGDYFKEESIAMGIEFLTKELGFKKEDITFTYFKGDKTNPEDKESLEILKKLNIPESKITGMGREDNFWGPTGAEGPCGPCVEMYVNGIEVWNHVFNEYIKTREGVYEPIGTKGVDTGAGFERILSILNKKNVYDTDLFNRIVEKIKELANEDDEHSVRVVADHLRTAVFILGDGVTPSNMDKGYVLRRLIRRAIRHGRTLGIAVAFTQEVAKIVVEDYHEIYNELYENREFIISEIQKEEEKFKATLDKGLKQFEKVIADKDTVTGEEAFDLFQTYGFPLEITEEMAIHKNKKVDKKGYEEAFKKHQELSRISGEKKFKGGLQSGGEMETKYHTVTHLLHQALRAVLGDHVKQAGSNITSDRMRFDFTHKEKMTPEEITEVEKVVNGEIKKGLEVTCEEMSLEDAKKTGAIGIFDHKYGDTVKVYSIGKFSKEICGGPHVKNTSELGKFKILKEESSSQGVRRIKAVLENV